jgi:multidrug efflux pump
MISHFFIDRPIFAAVLSIVITLTGFIALLWLPIAQYPEITPPSISVAISYPGASAQVVADTVAAPIEQQVNGVPGMLYMSSQSGNDGSYSLSVTFDVGIDLNTALVMVQNRVQLAMPQLPVEVQRQGITIRKRTPDILQVINFYSPDGRYDDIYLSNFATINVKDELLRVEGVSDINLLGERDYSVRAWLDPQRLAARNMTPLEVAAAIRSQSVEAAAGQVGQPPAPSGQQFQLPTDTLGRLSEPEQFGNIIIKVGPGGSPAGQTAPATLINPNAQPYTMPQPGTLAVPGGSGLTGGTPMTSGQGGGLPGTLPGLGPQPGTTTTQTGTGSSSGSTSQGGSTQGSSTQSGTSGQGDVLSTSAGPLGGSAAQSGASTGPPGNATQPGVAPPPLSATQPGLAVQSAQPQPSRLVGPQAQSTSLVRLRDVARVEMGAQYYNQACTFDGQPSVGLAIHQLPGTNALTVGKAVRKKMEELSTRFPQGVAYEIAYDISPYIRESVDDVVRTLFEAVFLVAVVVLLFLQNWRAALIPLIAVPVAIVGTFAVMAALNFSLNNISLFGLVLAIGIVVDDAIVVVENVDRWLEHGERPREAARKAMDEVTGPVIAVALVLCAVFVPCAFISGITGRFFRQFAVTISVSTVFSAINSLTLSPALAAILLKPHGARRDPLTWLLDATLGWFFGLFNRAFGAGTAAYTWAVGRLLRVNVLVLLAYAGLLALTWWVFARAPTGFIPDQDQGRLIINIQLPDAASLQRTQAAMAQVEAITRHTPGVDHTVGIAGMSFVLGANSSNFGSMFVILKPFEQRRTPELHANAIMARLRRQWAKQVKDAQVMVFGAPPIPGLSVAGGFKLMVEDRAGLGLDVLERQTNALIAKMHADPQLVGVFTQFRSNTPQLFMDVDRTKVASVGVPIGDLNQTLQMYLGSLYVNSFNAFGRYWQVTLQAEGRFRAAVPHINLIEARNGRGEMVPLGTLVTVRDVSGPVAVTRYNLYTAAAITGNLRPGASTGPAIATMEGLANQTLPRSMSTEWTELMFIQIRAGNTATYVFALAVLFVFLALAALYESWALPLAVILVVPLCLLCSVAGVLFTHLAVDIFVQIGLVVLVGLACKNAILIVEFAQQLRREGRPRYEATEEAVRLRLRPILMTSLAFILGVVPLVIATGAGAEMRRSLGTAVFSGMIGVTLFGIFLTPVFFYVIQGLGESRLFNTPGMQRFGFALALLLNIALLGLPALLYYLMRPLMRRPDRPAAPPEHADPEGHP